MDLELAGTIAVITGGCSGIGLATARQFARERATVHLWDIDSNVHDVAHQLARDFDVSTEAQCVDVSDWNGVQMATQDLLSVGASVDHVIHCAAVGSGTFGFPFLRLEPNDWKRVLDVNILGMVHIAHAWAPHFIERRRGSFVFVASIAGQIGSQTDPPYSASKAANINFAQCMAKDLAPSGVRVNTVCPGMVKTPLNESVWRAWKSSLPESEGSTYEAWAEDKIKKVVPLQRWQSVDDIASMIVFLASQRSGQVTGQTINVDGGQVMHW